MSEETKDFEPNDDLSLDDLSEFSTGGENVVFYDEEDIALPEDLDGFAKGFPKWDLEPPKN